MRNRGEARGVRKLARAIPERLSYANVMATAAVFIALGGSAWAVAKNSVGPRELKKNAVRAKHVKKNQIRAKHIKRNQIRAKHIRRNQVRPKHIRANSVRTPKISDSAVTEAKLAEGVAVSGPPGDQGPAGPKGEKGDSAFQVDCNEGLPADDDVMVRLGSVCIDRYEASVWDAPTGGNQITGPIPCNANGQDCDNIFARSVAGVTPRASIAYFQAQQALINSGKRLPTNAEWQGAASGTPDDTGVDTTPCNTRGSASVNTGSAAGCISDHGATDMVGNVWEWVADWVPFSTASPGWGDVGEFSSDDLMGLSGASDTTTGPGALIRGGDWNTAALAGPFAVQGSRRPSVSNFDVGFRGAR